MGGDRRRKFHCMEAGGGLTARPGHAFQPDGHIKLLGNKRTFCKFYPYWSRLYDLIDAMSLHISSTAVLTMFKTCSCSFVADGATAFSTTVMNSGIVNSSTKSTASAAERIAAYNCASSRADSIESK